jgi:RimJ/RimL family protein N-acetyltransferase
VGGYVWEGDRVRLRAVEPDDWQTFFDWNRDSDGARGSYHVPFPGSAEAARRWAAETALRQPEGDVFRWVVENLAGEMVGTINTHSCDPRSGTFGYGLSIRREHQRRGYASEAIALVLRYYFQELRYQKASVRVYSFNEPSIRLHERAGFQLEGRLRREIYTEGRYFDVLVFGMTAEEFAARATGSGWPENDQPAAPAHRGGGSRHE